MFSFILNVKCKVTLFYLLLLILLDIFNEIYSLHHHRPRCLENEYPLLSELTIPQKERITGALFLPDELFKCWNMNDTTCAFYLPVALHLPEFARYVQPTFGNVTGKCFHFDMQCFCSCGAKTARFHESDYLAANTLWWYSPWLMVGSLAVGADNVEQIEPENEVLFRQTEHFLLVNADEIAVFDGCERLGISLCEAEYPFCLQDGGRVDGLFQ